MRNLYVAKILEIAPSPYGYAVFIGAHQKVFVIYIERSRGIVLQRAFKKEKSERPFTHEFVAQVLDGLEAKVQGVEIYHEQEGTFFTRLMISMQNEVSSKIVEVDGRPSDTLALALRTGAPIRISAKVLEKLPDMSEALRQIKGI